MAFKALLSFLWFLLLLHVAAGVEQISLGNPFGGRSPEQFIMFGDAGIHNGALQLTPDTSNDDLSLVNKSGRIIYKKPYRIWESINRSSSSNETLVSFIPQKNIVSFTSSFVFTIYPIDKRPGGEGLAFVILSESQSIPDNSHGEFLGLTNSSLDGNPKNQFVAVEFDTFKQSYDPDANHIGININSVRSVANKSLSELNITLSPLQKEGVKYRALVEYSGLLRRIEVYLAEMSQPKPDSPLLRATVDLSAHLAEKSYFGFSGSTGLQFQLNCIISWNLTIEILSEDITPSPLSWFLKAGLPILAALLLAVAYFVFRVYKKRERRDQRLAWKLKLLPGMPREFPYSHLKKATGKFDPYNELGRGGYGVVYKGVIPGEKDVVAVKNFLRDTMQGDFLAELTIINRLRHKNLVRLLGWCHKKGKLLLVYEFMANGSLDKHLYIDPPGRPLEWPRRVQALAGVISALHYLHNEYDQTVVHRDLKTSNVMLDAEYNGRLGDFGLARAIANERNSYVDLEVEGVPGTLGYIAPECFHTGKATRESDVFGLGVVILEVVCGRRPRGEIEEFKSLADWVWNLHSGCNILGAVDARLAEDYDKKEAKKLLLLGLACSHPNYGDRPKTNDVLQVIRGSASPPGIPLVRPAFIWPPDRSAGYDDDAELRLSTSTGRSSSSSRLRGQQEYSGTPEFLSIPLR